MGWGTKEPMAGIVPESWLKWDIGTRADRAPRPSKADKIAACDAVTKDSRKAQQKLGKDPQKAQQKLGKPGQPGSSHRAHSQHLWTNCRRQHARCETGLSAGMEEDQDIRQWSRYKSLCKRGGSHGFVPSCAGNVACYGGGGAPTYSRSSSQWKMYLSHP